MTLTCPRCGLKGGVDLYDAEARAKLDLPLVSLLPERTRNALWKIEYVGELIQLSESDLLKIRDFGRRRLQEVKEVVADLGFRLGTYIENWLPPGVTTELYAKLNMTLFDFDAETGLSVRASNALQCAGIHYVGELVQKSPTDLLKLPNFGRKSLTEVKAALAQIALRLETHPNWTPPEKP